MPVIAGTVEKEFNISPNAEELKARKPAFERKMTAGFGVALAVLSVLGFMAYTSLMGYTESVSGVAYTYKITQKMDALTEAILDAESLQRSYLVTGKKEEYLPLYKEALSRIQPETAELKKLIAVNPVQIRHFEKLAPLIERKIKRLEAGIAAKQAGSNDAEIARYIGAGRGVTGEIRTQLDLMRGESIRLLDSRNEEAGKRASATMVSLAIGGIFILALLLTLYIIINRETHTRLQAEQGLRASEDRYRRAAELLKSKTLELEKLNTSLEERRSQLQMANKELESFSYSVSHDLRTPLRSLDGFSLALLEKHSENLDEQGKDYLNRIRNNSQRMGQLIDDILQLSRLTRGEMTIETVNLSELAASVAADLKTEEPQRDVQLDIAPNLVVQGDKRLLEVVFQNLMGNAWKFTSRKSGTAHITFGVTEARGKEAYYIKDDGAGFEMDYVHKLFGAFQRLHAMTDFSGTGIGLATVARVIHRHGGEVWAEGAVNEGATFYFTLPQSTVIKG